jgi:molecular chaperone GrpE
MPNSRESDGGDRQQWRPEAGVAEHDRPEAAPVTPENADAAGQPPDLVEELARIEDRYKRALADLDNYRKRSQREIERRVQEAKESVISDWLEAVDSVERALRMGPEHPCYEGMRAVLDQMEGILAREGVVRIGAPGETFDPARHEAVAVRVASGAADRTILEVARSGFALGDRVIRPAQVVVARAPEHAP